MYRWASFQTAVFSLTFTAYALLHIQRKTLSYVEKSIISEWTPPETASNGFRGDDATWHRHSLFQDAQSAAAFTGLINAVFLFVYAPGAYVSGMMAERIDLRVLLSACMAISAVVMFIFGPVIEWTGSYSQEAYISLTVANGLLHSAGWPCVVAVMGAWFSKEASGYFMGFWSSSPSVGSVVGALLLSSVVDFGYDYAFLLTSSLLFCGSILLFFGLVISPQEVGLVPYQRVDNNGESNDVKDKKHNGDVDNSDWNRSHDLDEHDQTAMLLNKQHLTHTSYGTHSDQPDRSVLGYQTENTHNVESVSSDVNIVDLSKKSSKLNANHRPTGKNRGDKKGKHSVSPNGSPLVTGLDPTAYRQGQQSGSNGAATDVHYKQSTVDAESDTVTFGRDGRYSDGKRQIDGQIHNQKETVNSFMKSNGSEESNDSSTCPKGDDYPNPGLQQTEIKIEENCTTGHTREDSLDVSNENFNAPISDSNLKAISLFRALLLPGVIAYSLAFGCLKMVTYVFFFWLPFFLSSDLGLSEAEAARVALWYDVGGLVGGTITSFLMTKLDKYALVMSSILSVSLPFLYVFGILGKNLDLVIHGVLLVILGCLIGGVSNILSATISADLGRREAVRSKLKVISTVAGIMEGTGTVGAALGQLAVPYLSGAFGWDSVFYLLIVAVIVTVLSMLPITTAEVKAIFRERSQRHLFMSK